MNRVVRHAIACGCDPLIALQMATVNTATHFGLERELGSIAPGRRADVILTSDLTDPAHRRGHRAGRDGGGRGRDRRSTARTSTGRRTPAPTVHIGKPLAAPDFEIPAPDGANTVTAQGDRRGREPGADQGADRRAARGRAASSKATARSARSRWSNATGPRARWSTASSRASATRAAWPSPRPSRMTATT